MGRWFLMCIGVFQRPNTITGSPERPGHLASNFLVSLCDIFWQNECQDMLEPNRTGEL